MVLLRNTVLKFLISQVKWGIGNSSVKFQNNNTVSVGPNYRACSYRIALSPTIYIFPQVLGVTCREKSFGCRISWQQYVRSIRFVLFLTYHGVSSMASIFRYFFTFIYTSLVSFKINMRVFNDSLSIMITKSCSDLKRANYSTIVDFTCIIIGRSLRLFNRICNYHFLVIYLPHLLWLLVSLCSGYS